MEKLLETAGERGLSVKQLSKKLGIARKTVKYYIYTSKNTELVDALLHGSCKASIKVFKWTPTEMNYRSRKIKNKKINLTE
jgi:predicted transcriptional regulator